MGNAEAAAAAEARIRAAVERLQAEGRRPTLNAVVAEAGCSKATAAKVMRGLAVVQTAPAAARTEVQPQEGAIAERPSKRIGRPTSLTPEVFDTVCESVSAGVPFEVAAAVAGVSRDSFFDWMKRGGTEPGSAFEAFRHAIEKAEGQAILRNVEVVETAAKKQWTAAAWWLERRYPAHFGRRDAVAVVGTQEPVRIVVEHIRDWHARDVIDVEPERDPGRER